MFPHCFRKATVYLLLSTFLFYGMVLPSPGYSQWSPSQLPSPGEMVSVSEVYNPLMIKGIKINPQNPMQFDFLVSKGNSGLNELDPLFKEQSERLIKYFLACLTIPEQDLWVNLSPYEKDRMIPDTLGKTELGRDLLAQDYVLKQLTASLIYPEQGLGKEFWNRVYAKARALYGNVDVPVNTFNKVWILADTAKIFERNNTAFVVNAHLKVMLDEDYVSKQKHEKTRASSISSQMIREVILPEIEKEVNTGKNFASIRQIFNAFVLAAWYKKNLKGALLNQVYTDKGKIGGINLDDPKVKEEIYQRYLQAYKQGVFNFIKEDVDPKTQQTIPRKYFSGGTKFDSAMLTFVNDAKRLTSSELQQMNVDTAVETNLFPEDTVRTVIPQDKEGPPATKGGVMLKFLFNHQWEWRTFLKIRGITLPNQGEGMRIVLIGPGRDAGDLQVLLDNYPLAKRIDVIDSLDFSFQIEVIKAANKGKVIPEIVFTRADITKPVDKIKDADMVLAMRVFDENFFSSQAIARASQTVAGMLKPQGVFVLNMDETATYTNRWINTDAFRVLHFKFVQNDPVGYTFAVKKESDEAMASSIQDRAMVGPTSNMTDQQKEAWERFYRAEGSQSETFEEFVRTRMMMGREKLGGTPFWLGIKETDLFPNAFTDHPLTEPIGTNLDSRQKEERMEAAVRSMDHGGVLFKGMVRILRDQLNTMTILIPPSTAGVNDWKTDADKQLKELSHGVFLLEQEGNALDELTDRAAVENYPAVLKKLADLSALLVQVKQEQQPMMERLDDLIKNNGTKYDQFKDKAEEYLQSFETLRLKIESRLSLAYGDLGEDHLSVGDFVKLMDSLNIIRITGKEVSIDAKGLDQEIITINRFLLASAIYNAINNAKEAIEHEAGLIQVTFKKDKGHLLVVVSDNGPGIPTEMLKVDTSTGRPYLFNLNASTNKNNGRKRGLGLTESYYALNGKISVRNKEEGGAEVSMEIPQTDEAMMSRGAFSQWTFRQRQIKDRNFEYIRNVRRYVEDKRRRTNKTRGEIKKLSDQEVPAPDQAMIADASRIRQNLLRIQNTKPLDKPGLRSLLSSIDALVRARNPSLDHIPSYRATLDELDRMESDIRDLLRRDSAMTSSMDTKGGIDLQAKDLKIETQSDGSSVQMNFDPALLKELQSPSFAGVVPVIIKITPLNGPLPFLELEAIAAP